MLNVGSWQAPPKSGRQAWPRSLLVIKTFTACLCAQILPKYDDLTVSPVIRGLTALGFYKTPVLTLPS